MLTLKKVNAELTRAGIRAELVKGDGYFYFVGQDVELAQEQVSMACSVSTTSAWSNGLKRPASACKISKTPACAQALGSL